MLSIWKLVRSSSTSGPSWITKPNCPNTSAIASIVSGIGCNAPRATGLPGSVTSTFSAARRIVWASARGSGPRGGGIRRDLRAELSAARRKRSLDGLAHLVGYGPDARPIVRRQGADAAENGCQVALLAEVLDLERVERAGIYGRRYFLERPRLQASQIGTQAFEVHASVPHSRGGSASANCTCPESRPLDSDRPGWDAPPSFRTGTSRGLAVPPRFPTVNRARLVTVGHSDHRRAMARALYRGPADLPTHRGAAASRLQRVARERTDEIDRRRAFSLRPPSLGDLSSSLLRQRLVLRMLWPSPAVSDAYALVARTTICAKVPASRTAMSARILRSSSILASFRQATSLP